MDISILVLRHFGRVVLSSYTTQRVAIPAMPGFNCWIFRVYTDYCGIIPNHGIGLCMGGANCTSYIETVFSYLRAGFNSSARK
jgi:hypothetical protein